MQPSSVLITGGTGSFGTTMLRELLASGVGELRVLSRDEEKQDTLRNELRDPRVRFFVGDVRDRASVDRAVAGVECVFHAAALKQVPSCEFFPLEAVRTNILGSENVLRASVDAGVRSVVCLSTDKAVFPINAMGISKALMEKVAQSVARELGEGAATTVSAVRYGNVMYSRGSVIPLFVKQIRAGQPITVTEPTMTRFLMPLRDSVDLVKYAFQHARQGDLFIRKAPAATLADLIEALKRLLGVPDHPVKVIGWRHAEKLYETLASAQELSQAEDLTDYYRIRMDLRDLNYAAYFSDGDEDTRQYEDFHSHNCKRLNVDEVISLLKTLPQMQRLLEEMAEAEA
ncbi:MAG: SDR family NAD(P)-dependent oxidoreductase [Pseudomonadota bacterium]